MKTVGAILAEKSDKKIPEHLRKDTVRSRRHARPDRLRAPA
jgi:hypothetical protein